LRNPLSAPGDRIKAVLQLKNLSSRELARRTRLSRVRIKKIMSNEIYPNLEDVRLINAALYKDYGLNLLL
jgi:transcriptional regulator with XRE-family HTH domain